MQARPRNHALSVWHRATAPSEGTPNLAIASPFCDLRYRGLDSDTCQPQAIPHGLHEPESVAVAQHAIPRIPFASENENH
jgi:hypothetical protein